MILSLLLATLHLFLIGDMGEPDAGGEPVLQALTAELRRTGGTPVVVVLGDNIYPTGLPAESSRDYAEMARRITDQVDAIRQGNARGIVVPGNHDWDKSGPEGWERVRRQEMVVEQRGGEAIRWLPDSGCPGPVIVDDLDPRLRIIVLDTQWWLHPHAKPGQDSGCPTGTPDDIVAALGEALTGAGSRKVIVVGHHPLASRGTHGGHFTVLDHLFPLRNIASWMWLPLPAVGSLYPAARARGFSDQDISGGANREMRSQLLAAFAARPPWLYAAGHDHNLQLLDGTSELGESAPKHLVVSGAGIHGHTEPVDTDRVRVASSKAGFFRIDLDDLGNASITLLTVADDGRAVEIWTGALD